MSTLCHRPEPGTLLIAYSDLTAGLAVHGYGTRQHMHVVAHGDVQSGDRRTKMELATASYDEADRHIAPIPGGRPRSLDRVLRSAPRL
jgi:hypothetical protein